jgi:hypothetical protein
METSLAENFEFYIAHQSELIKDNLGKYLLIVNAKVVGSYVLLMEAYEFGVKEFGLGNFLLQFCGPGEGDYTATYCTDNVSF